LRVAGREILLTFDVEGPVGREDFIEPEILNAFYHLLSLLKKYDLQGLFFITGSVAENLAKHPRILELLSTHEIGYHSSSHSIKPRIFEYTDVENYYEAIEASLQRESSSVNPLTGDLVGKGGILALREIFPEKKIDSFRAPFLCWSPPHLEALRKLGFRFDFSADVSNIPRLYKGITFMPTPTPIDSLVHNLDIILKRVSNEKFVVFMEHPSHILFKRANSSHKYNNPFVPVQTKKRSYISSQTEFSGLEMLFSVLSHLQEKRTSQVKSSLDESRKPLDLEKVDIKKVYETSLRAPKKIFGYKPKFLLSHFFHFFENLKPNQTAI
jgi:hypothetical protein